MSGTPTLSQAYRPKFQQAENTIVVQERLGYVDITLTLNTHSHVLLSMQEDAAGKLDELLTPIDVSQQLKKIEEERSRQEALLS